MLGSVIFALGPIAYGIIFRSRWLMLFGLFLIPLFVILRRSRQGKEVRGIAYFIFLLLPILNLQNRFEILGITPWDSPSVRTHFEWSRLLRNPGSQEYAISEYDKAIEKGTRDLEAYAVPAFILSREGKHSSAAEYMAMAVERLPHSSDARRLHGDYLYLAGEYSRAADEYRRAIEGDPKRIELYLKLGQSLESVGEYEDALKIYEAALSLNPKGKKITQAIYFLKIRMVEE
jgi:tetratricopeptide (TPR) repeat protein